MDCAIWRVRTKEELNWTPAISLHMSVTNLKNNSSASGECTSWWYILSSREQDAPNPVEFYFAWFRATQQVSQLSEGLPEKMTRSQFLGKKYEMAIPVL